jgi:hypothetical protein
MFCLSTELNRIRKSKDTNEIQDVSYKSLSKAATSRVEFWLKKVATMVYLHKGPPIPSGHVEVPKRFKSCLKGYLDLSDEQVHDIYYLFKEAVVFVLRNYRPKNPLSNTLTVDTIDQSVADPNGPLYPYLGTLQFIQSRPYKK